MDIEFAKQHLVKQCLRGSQPVRNNRKIGIGVAAAKYLGTSSIDECNVVLRPLHDDILCSDQLAASINQHLNR
jgi:hypothetical protein